MGGSFTDNEDMEANHGLSFTLGADKVSSTSTFMKKRYEIARMENISLEESLRFLVSGTATNYAFQTRKPKEL